MLCKLDRQDDLCDYFIFAMAGFCFFNSGGCIIHTLRTRPDLKLMNDVKDPYLQN